MKSEFLMAINQLSTERELPVQVILEAVEAALVSAYKKDSGTNQEVTAKIDPESGQVSVFTHRTVATEVSDPEAELSVAEAQAIVPNAQEGDVVLVETTPKNFGRIAAQTAKQVIMQRIREAERERVYAEYAEKEGEIVIGTVRSVGDYGVVLSLGKTEAHMARNDQIPGERYRQGDRVKAYVSAVEKGTKGVRIAISRTHRNMLKRLLELEVPEIFNGTVEVRAIAREPGARSKVGVYSTQVGVDPVGSCVGMRGVRIQNIVNELNGEKIDVVEWNPDPATFIANALSPAKVLNVLLDEDGDTRTATVIVPEDQLSLAIGREGQNARLGARLTGWRIDIKSAAEVAKDMLNRPSRVSDGERPRDLLSLAEELLLQKSRSKAAELERAAQADAFEQAALATQVAMAAEELAAMQLAAEPAAEPEAEAEAEPETAEEGAGEWAEIEIEVELEPEAEEAAEDEGEEPLAGEEFVDELDEADDEEVDEGYEDEYEDEEGEPALEGEPDFVEAAADYYSLNDGAASTEEVT
ncbi:MAG: transcription termination/antitermination protein NusA, partial [Chloroflexi bacterium]|nr:transcription termination/antitermination protein NusA [Chloroflexota bacterium]